MRKLGDHVCCARSRVDGLRRRRRARTAARKVKVYDFSGDTIEGDLVKPEGSTVDARDFAKHSSLITHP